MSIQYSNPRPLEHESIPIITTPIQKLLFRKKSISGFWRFGHLNGWGRMTEKDGQRFEGSWTEGRRDGAGFVVNDKGDWFEGVWRAGFKEGPGEIILPQV